MSTLFGRDRPTYASHASHASHASRAWQRLVALGAFGALGLASAGVAFVGCGSDDAQNLIPPPGNTTPGTDAGDSGVDGSSPTDGGVEAAVTCTPTLNGNPAWKSPAGYPMDACTTAQIATILQDCYGTTFDQAKCDADQASMAACWACMVTNESATELGPLIHQGDFSTVNYPGCIAIEQASRTPASCGAQQGIALDCQMVACATPCSGLDAGGPSKVAAYNACLDQVVADGGACADYAGAAKAVCPGNDPSYATCYRNGDTFAVYAARVSAVFCVGGAPLDGGSDAEAGADAATDAPGDAPSDAPDAG